MRKGERKSSGKVYGGKVRERVKEKFVEMVMDGEGF